MERWERVAYLVVGLDIQLDFLAGEGADSVTIISKESWLHEKTMVGLMRPYLICMFAGAQRAGTGVW